MILELLLALILGILIGTFTGLAPGIHINLIATIVLANLAFLSPVSPIAIAVFIVAMSITHTFLDFIPSTYLGVPEEDTFVSLLPSQKMLLEGKGHYAITLALYGSLTGALIISLSSPLLIIVLPKVYPFFLKIVPLTLIFISLYLIFKEEKPILALLIFLLAGFIGYFSFNLPIKEPLFPLLTGLFGISSLITSLKNKSQIVKQKTENQKIISPSVLKNALAAGIIAPFFSLLPGLSSSHLTSITAEITKPKSPSFIFLTGLVNTALMALTFITLYALNLTRSGSAVALKSLLPQISVSYISIIISAIVISALASLFLGIHISKKFSKIIPKINYPFISKIILAILIILVPIISNPLGIITLIAASALGIFAILSETRRVHLMGCLVIPTILFYLF